MYKASAVNIVSKNLLNVFDAFVKINLNFMQKLLLH